MKKLIGFIGAPSTGKTTLTYSLFDAFKQQQKPVALAAEFVSDDVKQRGAPDFSYYIYEQYRYLFHQIRREEKALQRADYIITDSPLLIGYAYTLQQVGKATLGRQASFAHELEELFKEDAHRYDHLYLLEREAIFEDNGIRFHSEEQSAEFSLLLRSLLNKFNVKYKEIKGTVAQRTEQVQADILGNSAQSSVGQQKKYAIK